jgi:dephospho-CoA kinase
MLVIGLTGGIGSGKTTVANMFAELGVDIIDTDIIARQLVAPGQTALKDIAHHFGQSILNSDGQLDRHKLAKITFNNDTERDALESILHPAIKKTMLKELNAVSAPYCIAVIPLLIETGQQQLVDRVLVVDCDPVDQLQRVQQRDQRSEAQIVSIINSQASQSARLNVADDIIQNSADLDKLHQQVIKLHKKYLKMGT